MFGLISDFLFITTNQKNLQTNKKRYVAIVKCKGNTTNMRVHLNRHHPNIKLDCVTDDKKKPISQKTIQSNLSLFSKYPNSSSRAADINRAVAGFIVSDMRPLAIVDNLEFKVLLRNLILAMFAM